MKFYAFSAALGAAFLLLAPHSAHAQAARVVSSCGASSPYPSLNAGTLGWLTVDTNGTLCGSNGGGGASGTPNQPSTTVGVTSATLIAAAAATAFIEVCTPKSAANSIWVNWSGANATMAPPSQEIAAGTCQSWTSFIPTSAITAIASASTPVTVMYK